MNRTVVISGTDQFFLPRMEIVPEAEKQKEEQKEEQEQAGDERKKDEREAAYKVKRSLSHAHQKKIGRIRGIEAVRSQLEYFDNFGKDLEIPRFLQTTKDCSLHIESCAMPY